MDVSYSQESGSVVGAMKERKRRHAEGEDISVGSRGPWYVGHVRLQRPPSMYAARIN